jgi:hypothetical protein
MCYQWIEPGMANISVCYSGRIRENIREVSEVKVAKM